MMRRWHLLILALALSACNLPAPNQQSSSAFSTALAQAASRTPSPESTSAAKTTNTPAPGETPTISPTETQSTQGPPGKIVFTCQTTKLSNANQLCIINADGSGFRQLIDDPKQDHFFASFAPDGESIIYSANTNGRYEIYELSLEEGAEPIRLTTAGNNFAPAISPDGKQIVFTRNTGPNLWDGDIWIANRDGNSVRRLTYLEGGGWDPVWSPDGLQVLFASQGTDGIQLYIIDLENNEVRQVTHFDALRGRNDWSVNDRLATYAGGSWTREIILFDTNGGNLTTLTDGGNNLAPSFSPDGGWITFTSYIDNYRDNNGCEIYVMNIITKETQRLTDNDYCDWQPRWGK